MNLEEKLEEFELFLKEDEKAEATITKYKTNIRSFIEFSKDKELCKKTVIEFKEKLDQVDEYLPNTTNNYLVVINKFLNFIDKKDISKVAGIDLTTGFALGVGDQKAVNAAVGAAVDMANKTLESMRKALGEHSPSKKARASGINYGKGFH